MGFEIELLLLAVVAIAALGIARSLARIAAHNALFTPPEPELGLRIADGDVFVVRAFGKEQVCTAVDVRQHPDGYLVVAAEPVGST